MFVDGIGYGEKDPDKNPFSRYSDSIFLPLGGHPPNRDDIVYKETDPSMGIPGLPQSATGQTSLWTGFSGPQSVQRHINGFPTFTLKKIIAEHSILKVMHEKGKVVDLLNSYTPYYFEKIGKNPRFQSASTLVQKASGKPLKTIEDLRLGKSLYMDITHAYLREIGDGWLDPEDPILQKQDAYSVGKSVPEKFGHYDLAIFEYFITDKAGHKKNWEWCEMAIRDLENFINGILDALDPRKDSLIVTSDHGNMEDLSTDRHTKNYVPTLIAGKLAGSNHDTIHRLMDIPRFIYKNTDQEDVLEKMEKSEFYMA